MFDRGRDDIDNPSVAAVAHAGQGEPQNGLGRDQVLAKSQLEGIVAGEVGRAGRRTAGIVDQDLNRLLCQFRLQLFFQAAGIAHIGCEVAVLLTIARRQGIPGLRQRLFISRQQQDAATQAGQFLRGGQADAPARAADEGGFSV
ncbi:hypothetical protein MnTg04_01437 [bacterium MnTg04]|nr:hypothetical protein MnTg04_01437 [bacterium MnTg04]